MLRKWRTYLRPVSSVSVAVSGGSKRGRACLHFGVGTFVRYPPARFTSQELFLVTTCAGLHPSPDGDDRAAY